MKVNITGTTQDINAINENHIIRRIMGKMKDLLYTEEMSRYENEMGEPPLGTVVAYEGYYFRREPKGWTKKGSKKIYTWSNISRGRSLEIVHTIY